MMIVYALCTTIFLRQLFALAGASLEEGIGRAGEVSCDLVTHDYLHIPGGMLDIGEEIFATTGNVEVYTPTAEKFCGRSLSGLAIQEFAEKIKINDPLGAQDNNTIATPVTSECYDCQPKYKGGGLLFLLRPFCLKQFYFSIEHFGMIVITLCLLANDYKTHCGHFQRAAQDYRDPPPSIQH
jgi:hypothetical protein